MNSTGFDLTHSFDGVVSWTLVASILWWGVVAHPALRLGSLTTGFGALGPGCPGSPHTVDGTGLGFTLSGFV